MAGIDADGAAEIIVGDGYTGDVTSWKYRTATNDAAGVFRIESPVDEVISIAAGDLDGTAWSRSPGRQGGRIAAAKSCSWQVTVR